MEAMRWRITSCGMAVHSACKAAASWGRVCGWGCRRRRRRSNSSQRCSMGFKSGDLEGQGRTLMLWCLKKTVVSRAVWGRALSCWKTSLTFTMMGCTWGLRISSTYRWAVRFPRMCKRSVEAVDVAVVVLSRRWRNRMLRSCAGVVTRGLPDRGRSRVDPCCWWRFHSLVMVLGWTFTALATSDRDSPASKRPMALLRCASVSLGVTVLRVGGLTLSYGNREPVTFIGILHMLHLQNMQISQTNLLDTNAFWRKIRCFPPFSKCTTFIVILVWQSVP